jgi:thiamine-monophosphate kinase
MGGTPAAAFLSLALPHPLSRKWVDRFLSGLLRLAGIHVVELAGGDTAESPGGVLADIMVVGSIKSGRALLRSCAKVGDFIYVTGELGESAAALQLLASRKIRKRDIFPNPRIAIGEWLVRNRIANSAIDISDGLSTDLSHICEESGVGAAIDAEAIPIHSAARRMLTRYPTRSDLPVQLALHGGEDYELLFTAPKSKRVSSKIAGVKVTKIGEILGEKKMCLVQNGKRSLLAPHGWQYFQSRPPSRKP